MSINLNYLGLAISAPGVTPKSRSFRPPSWPPPKNWVCVEDKDGNPVSRYGDSVIDMTPWVGRTVTFNFGDGPQTQSNGVRIDAANADLLRVLFAWYFWGTRAPRAVATSMNSLKWLRSIIAVCSKEGIKASDLSRFPAVIDKVAASISASAFDVVIGALDRLRDAREVLGFELLDLAGIQRLKTLQPDHEPLQTVYIPPRIWTYIVNRVAECRNDFLSHQKQIEECFAFSVDAYENNGAVEYREKTGKSHRNPFQAIPAVNHYADMTYYGSFADTAQRFGIKDVIEKWSGQITSRRGIVKMTNYFQLVQCAALIDVAAFSLMRVEEASNIRWNCLRWEDDPVNGRIPLIESETTKTDADSNAFWITSPSVEPSIVALQSIARMRLTSAGRWQDGGNPKLITATLEPWSTGRKTTKRVETQPTLKSLAEVFQKFSHLFGLQQLTITEDDLKIARAVCPKLDSERYQVGNLWPLAWHQFRRTGAVNMFASGGISDSSIQLQLKHLNRLMSLYYGRGNTALHLNDNARTLLVNAFYENMGRELASMLTNRYVSPYGEEHKAKLFAPANDGEPVNLVNEGDANHLAKIYRLHQIGGRLTALGACMKSGRCDDADSFSSVASCAGDGDKKPCAHTLFNIERVPANQKRLDAVNHLLSTTQVDTPQYRYLEQEKRGLENYFVYIRKTA
ncbi:hypothetical protein [Undibacterium pigrum]|uniref:Integrase n=1 Tax=Undibacterium pigrum TaxID=401470 RepID=A0A318JHV0_9BURK|nr:hypothetical protein [Undibacterium pigrum]PXX46933.1 hypothetical protein DFR42_101509 [Undibacterium pigrum]